VRLGPVVATLVRSIWRQRNLVVVGLVLGVGLGMFVLPKALNSRATYEATVRMQILQSPTDAIFQLGPAIGGGEDGSGGGGSPELVKNLDVANAVAKSLPPSADGVTGTELLDQLTVTPISGSPLVDISYPSGSQTLASTIVVRYADEFADARNRLEREKTQSAVQRLQGLLNGDRDAAAPVGPGATAPASARAQLEALRIKAAVSDPATMVLSQVPSIVTTGTPVSRQVTLALGIILGLSIGAGAGLVLETAFRRVNSQSDVEEASGLPYIASVRKNGIRHTSLPVIERPYSPAAEDYRRVGSALERQGVGGDIKVLAILSADPKEGKTLLAANLAHSLARQGRGVVLVSSDLRSAQVEKLVGLRPRPGLAEALQDESTNVIAQLVSINEHLLVLPAGLPNKHPGELLASRRLVEIVNTLRQLGSIVILDTPPVRLSADAIALSGVADASLLVAKSGTTRMRSLREATSGLRRDRLRQLGVVLVGVSSPLLRLPYPNRGGDSDDERDPQLQNRPVHLISPRRPHHELPRNGDQGGDRNVAGERQR
jgi:capsular exopolysaccharide synthesis family protein